MKHRLWECGCEIRKCTPFPVFGKMEHLALALPNADCWEQNLQVWIYRKRGRALFASGRLTIGLGSSKL